MKAIFEEKYVFAHVDGDVEIIENFNDFDIDRLRFFFNLARSFGYNKPRMTWTETRWAAWENYTHKTYRIDVTIG